VVNPGLPVLYQVLLIKEFNNKGGQDVFDTTAASRIAEDAGVHEKIHYIIHTDGKTNSMEVRLETDDSEAAKLMPQILEGLLKSTAQGLYTMFGMEGERV